MAVVLFFMVEMFTFCLVAWKRREIEVNESRCFSIIIFLFV